MINQVLETLFWILVGAVISKILDKPIERFQRRVTYGSKGIVARLRKSDVPIPVQDEFRVGKWHANWVTVEGSSSDPYTPNNVVCQFDPTPIVLPPDRQEKKNTIEQMNMKLERSNKPRENHNGPTASLIGIGRGQIGYTEEPFLVLRLRPSDYYSFLATTMSLDEEILAEGGNKITVREKYLHNLRFDAPIPEFAGAFAINLNVITSDGYIAVSKRATEGITGYAGYISPAINECVNPVLDRNANGVLSLFATAQRGASHELNINIAEDELAFFTLGVDTRTYCYLLTGLICSKTYSKDDIIARRSLGSKERWETRQLFFLPHNIESIAKFMRDTSKSEMYSPVTIVCLAQTLIHEFGVKLTEHILSKYPPFRT